MKFKLNLTQRLLLCLTPLVTGSVFTALPSFAATLASSQAEVNFSNFSHNPLTIETQKSPNTIDSNHNGQVVAESNAEAMFSIDPSNPSGTRSFSSSSSRVEGNASDYSQNAQSSSRLEGYTFQVGAGETFSFDFQGLLSLNTSVDYEPETAHAFGTIAFQLYDNTDSTQPPILLDFFTISAGLNSANTSDFLDTFKSSSVIINPNGTNSTTQFGGNQEAANIQFTGRISRFFERTTTLFLKQFESNEAGASCPAR